MCSRLTATGFVASCILLAAYWGLSTPLRDQPRYGYYSHRFVAFVSSYPVPGYADQYQFLGGAAAALGAFHALNPPVLITTLGGDHFTTSRLPVWRTDARFCLQAICLSFWWWWLLGRLASSRGDRRVTLVHAALGIPLLCLAASVSLYRSLFLIHGQHGLTGFANVAPAISLASLCIAVVWARRNGFWRPHRGAVAVAAFALLLMLLWPPMITATSEAGHALQYRFVGHTWLFHEEGLILSTSSLAPFWQTLHVALNLQATELLVIAGALLASAGRLTPACSGLAALAADARR